MILITIGLMCSLELKKEQLDKNRKIIVLNNSFKNVFLLRCFRTKTCFYKKNICFKTSSHLYLWRSHMCDSIIVTVMLLVCDAVWWNVHSTTHQPSLFISNVVLTRYRSKRSKVKGQDTCCNTAYMSQTQEQHFTISKVAADWQELMIPQCIKRPSVAHSNGQLDLRCS